MRQNKKTNSEYIIDALRSGEKLRSRDITERASVLSGRKMKIQDVASILTKLSDSNNCDFGFFLFKKKDHKGYTYSLVQEALQLNPEKLYDLTRKTGQNRYTLEQVIRENPSLKKHVKARMPKPPQQKTNTRKRSEAAAVKSTAKKANIPKTHGIEMSDHKTENLFQRALEKISDQGGLSVHINLNISFS